MTKLKGGKRNMRNVHAKPANILYTVDTLASSCAIVLFAICAAN